MKVIVIGSGLIGLTTAYFLRRHGHEVTVIDREEGPGRETSFANGALLTPSMPEPWNAPGSWRVLLRSLVRSDAALQLRLRALPSLGTWGVRFLANSKPALFERNTVRNVRLALSSLKAMEALRQETHIEYGCASPGSLRLFRNPGALQDAVTSANSLLREGLTFRQLSRDETIAKEPALAPVAGQLAGAIYYPSDETGDAYQFCVALAEYARQQGVEFRFQTAVSSLDVRSGRVMAMVSGRERSVADQYVVAAGSYSTPLLRPLGIRLPVRPAKGYSVTFNLLESQGALRVPLVDDDWHAVVVPLGGAIRVAGTAEFAGFDLSLRPERVRNLVNLAQRILPRARLDLATAKPWCGLRAMSADGVPIIGGTPVVNLWVNTGHGHLGWTMAAGSAQLLADLMSADSPAIDPAPFALARFSATR